ncbi:hypothetical protein NFI95_02240 [Acetobacteraceae bacterium KSS8]|uniref:Copper chaperone PCu(A)C n=1 Tax=Endosaccharibacter trunci TaxID=2812733 RepID=A0ABT1W330_9PROT|nr:hypothetical protein [Acetobacteraceae bacterium KSS8]
MSFPDRSRLLLGLLAGGALSIVSGAALASEVAGPIEIGPSWASADPARSTATLFTMLQNQGDLPDRLIRAECPASGHVALLNGSMHSNVMAPNPSQAQQGAQAHNGQNGLDLPPAGASGSGTPVKASFSLSDAKQPLTDGAHLPCALWFAHAGERVVVFTVGAEPQATKEP